MEEQFDFQLSPFEISAPFHSVEFLFFSVDFNRAKYSAFQLECLCFAF